MKYEVKSYNFFKVGGHYEYAKDGGITVLSEAMMACLLAQYQMMGFKVVADNPCYISVAKIMNETEVFLEKLLKKA